MGWRGATLSNDLKELAVEDGVGFARGDNTGRNGRGERGGRREGQQPKGQLRQAGKNGLAMFPINQNIRQLDQILLDHFLLQVKIQLVALIRHQSQSVAVAVPAFAM